MKYLFLILFLFGTAFAEPNVVLNRDITSLKSKVKAYRSSDQAMGSGAYDTVDFNAESFDINNEFNTSTYRFQPTKAGYYLISTYVGINDIDVDDDFILRIRKNNGSTDSTEGVVADKGSVASHDLRLSLTNLIYLDGNDDYIFVEVYHDYGSNRNISGGSDESGFIAVQVL